jgi:hypothetical protein
LKSTANESTGKKLISLQLRKGQKITVAGLALLAFVAMIYLFTSLNRSTHTVNEALDLKQLNLAKYRQKLLEKKVVERELLALRNTMKQAEAALLTGKTQSLAAAEIQEIVKLQSIPRCGSSPSYCINSTAQPSCCALPNWGSDHAEDEEGAEVR